METNRNELLVLLKKVQASASKEGAPEHKIATGLKKILTKHIKAVPGDSALMEVFLEKGTVPFCTHVTSRLQENILTPFSSTSTGKSHVTNSGRNGNAKGVAKGTAKGSTKGNTKSVWHKLATVTKRVEYDPGPESLPTQGELHEHYQTVLSTVTEKYPELRAPPEALTLYRKGLVGGPYEQLLIPVPLFHFLSLVRKEEVDPPLFSLLDRLERLLLPSLLAFLPLSDTVAFLVDAWDGSDDALLAWEREQYHQPLFRIVQDESMSEKDKKTRLEPLLHYWARIERCGMLASLRFDQVEEFLRLVSAPVNVYRKMNAPQLLDSLGDSGQRRMVHLDSSLTQIRHRMVPYFAFWDLSWLPWASSCTLVPMDPATLPLSEKQFASQYFDPSTTFSGSVLMWCGKVPFRVEYRKKDGSRVVQTEAMYEEHKRYREEKGWEVRMKRLPVHEREVWNNMILKWVSFSLSSFLDPKMYDVEMMSRLIVKPVFSATTLGERVRLAYNVVGRLHPYFPLSRHHGVLRQRIQHLYFSLETLVELPLDLLFPEYFLDKDTHQKSMDKLWALHLEEFRASLLVQCAQESFHAMGGGTLPAKEVLVVRKSLDRNTYVHKDRRVTTLTKEWCDEWENFFWDEDVVPQGLDSLYSFVEAPGYFRFQKPVRQLSESDLHRFLDEWRTMPSFSPYPVYESETENENVVSEVDPLEEQELEDNDDDEKEEDSSGDMEGEEEETSLE